MAEWIMIWGRCTRFLKSIGASSLFLGMCGGREFTVTLNSRRVIFYHEDS